MFNTNTQAAVSAGQYRKLPLRPVWGTEIIDYLFWRALCWVLYFSNEINKANSRLHSALIGCNIWTKSEGKTDIFNKQGVEKRGCAKIKGITNKAKKHPFLSLGMNEIHNHYDYYYHYYHFHTGKNGFSKRNKNIQFAENQFASYKLIIRSINRELYQQGWWQCSR